jgi:hypothetical protein
VASGKRHQPQAGNGWMVRAQPQCWMCRVDGGKDGGSLLVFRMSGVDGVKDTRERSCYLHYGKQEN